jgi:phage shock protein A
MRWEQVAQYLREAEDHMAQGRQHIASQIRVVEELERHGHDATRARSLLVQFKQVQRLHIAEVERLSEELARLK